MGVGHTHDPIQVRGLAHLVAKMLFSGCQKYPDATGFKKFMEDHSGDWEAITDLLETSFRFSIGHALLGDLLDRVASHFKSPSFSSDVLEEIVEEIEDKFNNDGDSDDTRLKYLIFKNTVTNHSVSRYHCGNR